MLLSLTSQFDSQCVTSNLLFVAAVQEFYSPNHVTSDYLSLNFAVADFDGFLIEAFPKSAIINSNRNFLQ